MKEKGDNKQNYWMAIGWAFKKYQIYKANVTFAPETSYNCFRIAMYDF